MNIETGEIGDMVLLAQKQLAAGRSLESIIALEGKPKPSCRYCHGRGYEFTTVNAAGNTMYIPCRCTMRKRGGK